LAESLKDPHQFNVNDIMGEFDRRPDTTLSIIERDGRYFDKYGR
jgi:hypothetical protein